jgi:biopolymer transport protein ExbB/TolQ
LFIFVCSSIWIGNKTYSVAIKQESTSSEVGWFIAETCLALGMVGTIIGFLLLLGTTFSNINVSDVTTLQRALSDMALGMSTALYTTLIGLICSILIKVQLVNLEVVIDENRNS